MGMAQPERRRVTIGDVVREALDALPDVDDDEELFGRCGWKAPFAVARRIQKALFDHRVDFSDIPASQFFPIVEEWAQYHLPDEDSFTLSFARLWDEVRLPEGYDPAEFAYSRTLSNDWRLEVDPAYYTKKAEAEDAAMILTFFGHLQDWLQEEGEDAYCSARKLERLMGKSRRYVLELVRCLVAEGALVEEKPGTAYRAPRYRVVQKPNERKPLQRCARRSRRSRGPEDSNVLTGNQRAPINKDKDRDSGEVGSFLEGEVIGEEHEGGFSGGSVNEPA